MLAELMRLEVRYRDRGMHGKNNYDFYGGAVLAGGRARSYGGSGRARGCEWDRMRGWGSRSIWWPRRMRATGRF